MADITFIVWLRCTDSKTNRSYWMRFAIPYGPIKNRYEAIDKALNFCIGRTDPVREAECFMEKPYNCAVKSSELPSVGYEFKRVAR